MSLSSKQLAILETLSFFDITSFPLTQTELFKYLYSKEPVSYEEIENISDSLKSTARKHGMYMLSQRQSIVHLRQKRFLIAEKKYKKALRITKILTIFVPGIKAICVCNSLGYSNAKEGSDIDLFLICKQGSLYQTRLLSTLLMMILGQRPSKKKRKDKICLSFFLSEESMNLQSIQEGQKDIYLLYWIALLFPIYNKDKTYERFIEANRWLYESLPNYKPVIPSSRRKVVVKSKRFFSTVLGWIPESVCTWVQTKRLPSYLNEKKNEGTHVVMNRDMIKLHANDRRHWFYLEWRRRVKKMSKYEEGS